MRFYPRAKTSNIVQLAVENELLLYDLAINKAFCLNKTSANIYNLCNGKNEITNIAKKINLPVEIVKIAINALSKQNLLTEQIELYKSRRQLLKNVALTTAALPLISIVSVPSAIQAASSLCGGSRVSGEVFRVLRNDPFDTNDPSELCDRNRNECISCQISNAVLVILPGLDGADCTCL